MQHAMHLLQTTCTGCHSSFHSLRKVVRQCVSRAAPHTARVGRLPYLGWAWGRLRQYHNHLVFQRPWLISHVSQTHNVGSRSHSRSELCGFGNKTINQRFGAKLWWSCGPGSLEMVSTIINPTNLGQKELRHVARSIQMFECISNLDVEMGPYRTPISSPRAHVCCVRASSSLLELWPELSFT